MSDTKVIKDDKGDVHKCVWRVPEIGERYFRKGSDHVAVLTVPCKTPRYVVVETESGRMNFDGSGRRKVQLRGDWA